MHIHIHIYIYIYIYTYTFAYTYAYTYSYTYMGVDAVCLGGFLLNMYWCGLDILEFLSDVELRFFKNETHNPPLQILWLAARTVFGVDLLMFSDLGKYWVIEI